MEQGPRCVEEEVEDLMAANDGEEEKEATEVVVEEEAPGLEGLVINCLGAKHQDEPIVGVRKRNARSGG